LRAKPKNGGLHVLKTVLRVGFWVAGLLALAGILLVTAEIAVNPGTPGPIYLALINLNLVLALCFVLFIGRRLILSVIEQRSRFKASKLPQRLVGIFSILAILPAIIVAIFSVFMLNQGIEVWFSDRVTRALEGSRQVAQAYLAEHSERLKLDTELLASSQVVKSSLFILNPSAFTPWLDQSVQERVLDELMYYSADGVLLAQSGTMMSSLNAETLMRILESPHTSIVIPDYNAGQIVAGSKMASGGWLIAVRWLPPSVQARINETTSAFQEYFDLRKDQDEVRTVFTLFMLLLGLASLVGAIWAGLRMARQITRPVMELLTATQKVSMGDLEVRLIPQDDDEIGILTQSFNRMTRQLRQNRELLERKNHELDDRRRMVEGVLTGVSSGVVTLDDKGIVRLANKRARDELELKVGANISDSLPEVARALPDLLENKNTVWQQQIQSGPEEASVTLLVRLVQLRRRGSGQHAAVMTFDNITELLAAQRTAAWSDIARKLAHEIKNPLTPIQLSAERLNRKYAKQIEDDKELFGQLTQTIVNQVENMRQLLNEFSDFARMPAAEFAENNIVDILEEILVLQKVGRSHINFDVRYSRRELPLLCDHNQLNRAFTNIIENAVNAIEEDANREEKGPGEVKVVVKMTQGAKLMVTVSDNGRGLPEKMELNQLFDPYVTTRQNGTGLGLAIVRRVVDEHEGQIQLKRRRGGGTVVEIVFPLKRSQATKEAA
jgi:two-component system nitrogen regulation sensor histidine kinase NtrY